MARKDELGRAGEERAARYLTARGYTVLARNWRGDGGELDLVAARGAELVVVEVKTRSGARFGHPLEAIDARKLARLWRLALQWRAQHPEHARGRVLRIDAIALIGRDPATAALEHLQDLR
jgi:putative endonuclease